MEGKVLLVVGRFEGLDSLKGLVAGVFSLDR